ncbi:hypothetical protein GWI33_019032 [Rhynchophorus ferrugineus]|uniref:Uncharacterized protein n=1 Tax=Rhynchophorus ferrugineus TaxID=354439 RepID=A0A834M5P3_RHYFE|nr:hypothetical protein GWI33_019032 [Rhynchophorus ferrugineus]
MEQSLPNGNSSGNKYPIRLEKVWNNKCSSWKWRSRIFNSSPIGISRKRKPKSSADLYVKLSLDQTRDLSCSEVVFLALDEFLKGYRKRVEIKIKFVQINLKQIK